MIASDTAHGVPAKRVVTPVPGEVITSLGTGNSFTMGPQIGEGAFGQVFECTDVWGAPRAAKVLKPTSSYEIVRQRATSESHKLLLLRHPNITYVFDAFEYRDTFYIITERCHLSVEQLFSLPDFNGSVWGLPLARSLLQAVQYLHVNRYVHQDIHAGNVFLAYAYDDLNDRSSNTIQFKLGDLGVTRLAGEVAAENTRARWMLPPEVLRPAEFGPIDHRVDIYHAGLLLLQVLHSRPMSFTEEEVLAGRPRDLALELGGAAGVAIEKCLRRRVEYRTASAMDVWRDLTGQVVSGSSARSA